MMVIWILEEKLSNCLIFRCKNKFIIFIVYTANRIIINILIKLNSLNVIDRFYTVSHLDFSRDMTKPVFGVSKSWFSHGTTNLILKEKSLKLFRCKVIQLSFSYHCAYTWIKNARLTCSSCKRSSTSGLSMLVLLG